MERPRYAYRQNTYYVSYEYRQIQQLPIFAQDTQIGGYDVPKGSMVVPMQWAVHTDPSYWQDPFEYRPDRFLTEDGSFFKPESFLPFQCGNCLKLSLILILFFVLRIHLLYLVRRRGPTIVSVLSIGHIFTCNQLSYHICIFAYLSFCFHKGKRVCVGEELARMILFLFAGRILHAFTISIPLDEMVDLEGECGITLVPKPHRLTFLPRRQ